MTYLIKREKGIKVASDIMKYVYLQRMNADIYRGFEDAGFDYILNPDTEELHRVDLDNFTGSHNLRISNLENFIGIVNLGSVQIHKFRDGESISMYDLETGDVIGEYKLNKCLHCFPPKVSRRLG